MTFIIQHVLGFYGMPRRIFTYPGHTRLGLDEHGFYHSACFSWAPRRWSWFGTSRSSFFRGK